MPEENGYNKVVEALADMNEAIGTSFEKVWSEFASVNTRFDQVDQRLMEHDRRFDQIDRQLAHVLERLNRIESLILQEHARRLEALEEKVGTGK